MNKTTMKPVLIAAVLLLSSTAHAAGTAINETGETPHASAMLDVRSVTKGLLPPRMTAAERGGIASPAAGLMVYQTDGTTGLYLYNGTAWKQVLDSTVIQATGTAAAADVLSGSTFSTAAAAGLTGTMTNNAAVTITPAATAQPIAAGYHNGSGTVATDTNLVTGNIKSGATIFGVTGKSTVMETSSGTAAAGNILTGKTAFVNGATVTGTVAAGANVTGGNGVKVITIPSGLYAGTETVTAADTNLIAANIKSGTAIFGVTGTAVVATYPAVVPRTGQTTAYETNTPKRDDGTLQKGVAWPNPRFTINAGTVTDNLTGLIWLQNAFCDNTGALWQDAFSEVVSLNTSGTMGGINCGDTSNTGSTHQTDWRLPNINELHSLMSVAYFNPALSNTAGTGKWVEGSPFTNIMNGFYWSSSSSAASAPDAWIVDTANGSTFVDLKAILSGVWPVRGGQ